MYLTIEPLYLQTISELYPTCKHFGRNQENLKKAAMRQPPCNLNIFSAYSEALKGPSGLLDQVRDKLIIEDDSETGGRRNMNLSVFDSIA